MCPVELEIKETAESNTSASYLDLLLSTARNVQLQTSISDKRVTTILTPTSHTFRSWIVIFHLHRSMAFLSHDFNDMPVIAPHMNVLFWGPSNFRGSYLNINSEKFNCWYAIWRSYNTIRFLPLTNVKWHSETWRVAMTSIPISLYFNVWHWYLTWPLLNYEWFLWSILRLACHSGSLIRFLCSRIEWTGAYYFFLSISLFVCLSVFFCLFICCQL